MALDVPDDLWAVVEPLLPPGPPKPRGGRPRAPDRAALAGVLFVLRAGARWRGVPAELGRRGKTCWRRLSEWHAAGVWARLHRVLLDRLRAAGVIDRSLASLDSASVRARRGAKRRGRTRPTAASRAPSATPSRTRAARRWA